MAEGVRIESGRENRSKLLFKAPVGVELKRHALNWTKEDNPKESDVVFELRGWFYSRRIAALYSSRHWTALFWVGDYKTYLNYRQIIKHLDAMGYC